MNGESCSTRHAICSMTIERGWDQLQGWIWPDPFGKTRNSERGLDSRSSSTTGWMRAVFNNKARVEFVWRWGPGQPAHECESCESFPYPMTRSPQRRFEERANPILTGRDSGSGTPNGWMALSFCLISLLSCPISGNILILQRDTIPRFRSSRCPRSLL